jgi:hypothetical protein
VECFKDAYKEDVEWREAKLHGDSNFEVDSGLVFYSGKLYVPETL